MILDDPVSEIKGVGPVLSQNLATLKIKSISDLFNYYPRRYDDFSKLLPISKLRPGRQTIKAKIKSATGRFGKSRLHITEAIATDSSGSLRLIWFNQPYRAASLNADKEYYVSGNFELKQRHFVMINPSIELVSDLTAQTSRILAVYPENKNVNSRLIRLLIKQVFDLFSLIEETLPPDIINNLNLLSKADALRQLHRPDSTALLAKAKKRLGFEEVFELSLASCLNKIENKNEKALKINFKNELAKSFVASLPFSLTNDQKKVIWQIYLDMAKESPMNRLVEGDVGSGKTVVAVMAALMVIKADKQVAYMAPTELLAYQHAQTVKKLLSPSGLSKSVSLLTGSLNKKQKETIYDQIVNSKTNFIIGTHAIIQENVKIPNLALVIIDEQHRFGVDQRKALIKKAGHMPHLLSLTATPIPRSLALTLYGELNISLLKDKPADRAPVITKIIKATARHSIFNLIDQEISQGRQVFVVCPSIDINDNLVSVEAVYESFKNNDFKHRRVGLVHGRLKAADRQKIMEKFISKEIDILVATTVIEVGVDIPNATVMVIFNPERFGLAQLHQLRGRIGRGAHQSYCYLILNNNETASRRLSALASSSDGFKLAELDLKLRGPGAIYGKIQHGILDLRIAELNDSKLINMAVNSARQFADSQQNLLKYPYLLKRVNQLRAVTNLN